MSVGLLLITHGEIGKSLHDTVVSMIGRSPLTTRTMNIRSDCDPEKQITNARKHIIELDQGDGVLVLTDLYGSTPSNIACSLKSDKVAVVAGVNLPMLVRIMNYPSLKLVQLQQKALSGGQEGVFSYVAEDK